MGPIESQLALSSTLSYIKCIIREHSIFTLPQNDQNLDAPLHLFVVAEFQLHSFIATRFLIHPNTDGIN